MNNEIHLSEASVAALHAVRLDAVLALYKARSKDERDALHDQAVVLSTMLGLMEPVMPIPPSDVTNATVAAFWAVVEAGLAAKVLHNHSNDADRLAFNLPEVRAAAKQQGRFLPKGMALNRALLDCPRLMTINHAVSSTKRTTGGGRKTVKCWIFSK